MLPPPKMSQTGDDQTSILHSGPVTIHREHAKLAPRTRRLWMELGPDMITTYPSADEEGRVRPIRSILLSTIKQLYPMDLDKPFEVQLRYAIPKGEEKLIFTVDTEESALHWHRDLESALFQHGRLRRYQKKLADRKKALEERPNAPSLEGLPTFEEDDGGWEMLRICLPLDRVNEVGTEDYMDFARIISLDVDVMEGTGKGMKAMKQPEWCKDFDMLHPTNLGYRNVQIKSPRSETPPRTPTFASDSTSTVVAESTAPSVKPRKRDRLAEALGFKHKHHSSQTSTGISSEPASPRASIDPNSPTTLGFASSSQSRDSASHNMPGGRAPIEPAGHTMGGHPNSDASSMGANPPPVTGQGAFRGRPNDPEDLTSNASILPANDGTIPNADHPESHTQVNIKFGILNERDEFSRVFHQTITEARQHVRVYKENVKLPMPVFEVGNSNLLKIREVEGGAGLDKDDMQQPNPDGTRRGSGESSHSGRRVVDGHETDLTEVVDTSDSEYEGDPGGMTESSKQKKAMDAKVTFGIPPEDTVWMKRCYLNRTVPFRGHIILSDKYLCFWRKTVGPIGDIKVGNFPLFAFDPALMHVVFSIGSLFMTSRAQRRIRLSVSP
jgi:hypothetical protein